MKPPRAYSGLRPRWIQIGLLSMVAVASLVLLIYLSSSVSTRLRELSSARADNVQWTLGQIEVEYLDFLMAITRAETRARLAGETTDPDAQAKLTLSLNDLRKRYNIFYSRMETISASSLYGPVLEQAKLQGRFDGLSDTIKALIPLIDGPSADLIPALPQMRDMVDEMRHDLRLVSTEGNRQLAIQADVARVGAARVLRLVAVVGLLLAIAVIWLLFVFWRLYTLNHERAQANRAMLSRIEAIISTSRDGILVCDPWGKISSFNLAAELLFGRSKAEAEVLELGTFLRRPIDGAVDLNGSVSQSMPVDPAQLLSLCAAGASRSEEMFGRGADGRLFPIELTVDKAEHNGETILVCFMRNITHRLAAQKELVRSRDKALAGERAKARFLAVMSHEMRTPLNGILGTVDLLEATPLSKAQAELADVLRNSGQVLLSHINEVLDITRLESGQITVESAPFDLDALMGDVMQSMAPIAAANGNRLTLTGQDFGVVLGARARLRQVLINLISNAVKFTKNGDVGIEVARIGGDTVEIQVTDTGCGIPSEALEQVFDDFVRLGEGHVDDVEGTGLGLGIARTMVRAMKGEIGAESEFGEGSLFWVRLPLPPADGAAERPAAKRPAPRKAAAPKPSASDAAPLQVLIVEDNKTNRFIAREMLRRDGHRVDEAHDGVEGVEAAAAQYYDLILMDISMPRMDGVEATRAIRASGGPSAHSRIIALTAHAQPEDHARFVKAGMEAVLSKPLRWKVLREHLYVDAPEAEDAAAAEAPSAAQDLDLDALAEMRAALPAATFEALRADFLAEGGAFIAALGDLQLSDHTQARMAIHGFAGSCATFGARAMHAALSRAETCAHEGHGWFDCGPRVLAPLPALWEALCAAMDSAEAGQADARPAQGSPTEDSPAETSA